MKTFKPYFWILLSVQAIFNHAGFCSEIYINPLTVYAGESFSFALTVKNADNLKSFEIDLHLPDEQISKVASITPPRDQYESFTQTSYYDNTLKSVVWKVGAILKAPVSGTALLFNVNAVASKKPGFNPIGIAVKSGELLSSFVHGGLIYVLDPNWPWYDIQINYQNAFSRMDFDNSGVVDKKDLFFMAASWRQGYTTDLPSQPTPTPTPISQFPTPTPTPRPIPSIEEFLGTWTFSFNYFFTINSKNEHMAFDAILNEDGFISVEGQSDRKLLGTYTYDSATGTISGVFLIINTNPVYTLETLDYFINFDGETGAGVTLSGAAQFTYNWNDIQIPGYESYGLTITDEGTFIAAKKP